MDAPWYLRRASSHSTSAASALVRALEVVVSHHVAELVRPLELPRARARFAPRSRRCSRSRARGAAARAPSTSAAMKIVTLRGTSSCTVSAPSSSSSSTQTQSSCGDPLDLGAQRPVPAPGDVRHPLEELVGLDPARELLVGEEPVVVPVDLARALRTRRRRDGDLEAGHALEEALDQRPLARSGRARDDEDGPPTARASSRGG